MVEQSEMRLHQFCLRLLVSIAAMVPEVNGDLLIPVVGVEALKG